MWYNLCIERIRKNLKSLFTKYLNKASLQRDSTYKIGFLISPNFIGFFSKREKSDLEKEYDTLRKELEKIQEVHKIEDMKAKIAEAKEKVQDKAKYLKDKKAASGGSWFSFLSPFRTDTSKHVTVGATLAIGLLCGALPLLLIGGLLALVDSDETKAKKASK